MFLPFALQAGEYIEVPVTIEFGGSSDCGEVKCETENKKEKEPPGGSKGGSAWGSLASARFSDNAIESIGCEVKVAAGMTEGYCEAVDAAGNTANCHSSAPDLVAAMRGIGEYSYLRFEWNGKGNCTSITTGNGSRYLPDTRDLGLGAPGNSGGRGR